LGETGAGKEVVARVIHKMSARAHKPFVEVNCAAIPEELIESELFGYEKGAFTGANATKRGKFDMANGGTLFLDEIADMSLRTQAKILRILQEQSFERVGGTETHHVDVRVIAATNKDLREEIEAGRFREDLYYRLNVIPLKLPPLRERPGDVALLAEHFLERFCRETGRERKHVLPEAMEVLEGHSWPGNVRELKNAIERLVIMTPGTRIGVEDLPELAGRATQPGDGGEPAFMGKARLKEARNDFERQFILRKLDENDWNISKTAEVIGLERSNLHRKIKAYGIEVPPSGKGR
ncbi:MAG: sigma-54-dependent Fis family transcriptional regulator, partial [Myxococcales bacterium]|nr:sigma-54-dependent Fis family transcriptional regulator [Myxococcales bacterium]